jgi:hypothetical protein
MAAKHPEIRVRLDVAGDDFRIIDHVTKAMRRAGIQPEEIEKFCDEAMSGEDRDLLQICGRWVTLVPDWQARARSQARCAGRMDKPPPLGSEWPVWSRPTKVIIGVVVANRQFPNQENPAVNNLPADDAKRAAAIIQAARTAHRESGGTDIGFAVDLAHGGGIDQALDLPRAPLEDLIARTSRS